MNEKSYKKRLDFQQKMISRQSEQIEKLKSEIEDLKEKIKEKDEKINSVAPLREELKCSVANAKKYEKDYGKLINELKKMGKIMDVTVYKGRWRLVKWLIR